MRINNVLSTILGNVKNVYTAALVAAGLIAGISLLGACANPVGDDGNKNITEPEFVSVTGITGVTESAVPPGYAINLSVAQALPDNATNKTIVWSIVNDADKIPAALIDEQEIDTETLLSDEEGEGVEAGTGAKFVNEDVDGNTIKKVQLNAEGTLVLKAVIANGVAAGTEYAKFFVFTVVEGVEPPFVAVTGISGVTGAAVPPAHVINLSAAQVLPNDATNKTIVWSIVNDAAEIPAALIDEQEIDTDTLLSDEEGEGVEAGTGAKFVNEDVDGNTIKKVHLNATGTLVLKAVIANGVAEGTDYTQLFVFTVVDGTAPPPEPVPSFVAVTGISGVTGAEVPPAHMINLSAAQVLPNDATNKTIVWSIIDTASAIPPALISEHEIDTATLLSDEAGNGVADGTGAKFVNEEDDNGNLIRKVQLNAEGTLVLKAAIANGAAAGTEYAKFFVFTVVDGSAPPPPDPNDQQPSYTAVTNVAIQANGGDITDVSLSTGGTIQLNAVVTPSTASNTDITWSSNNTSVAAVGGNGLVTAVGVGTATITAAANADNKSDTVTVAVAAGKGVYNTATDAFLSSITTLADALTYINSTGADYNAASNEGQYTIVLADNESITDDYYIGTYNTASGTSSHTGACKNLQITLKSINEGTTVTLYKTDEGALFTIYGFNAQDVPTLILDSGITLKGYNANNSSLVVVGNGTNTQKANFEMRTGSRITENITTTAVGGIIVKEYSQFTMTGGMIDHNKAIGASGGGVYVAGIFEMSDGEISHNEVSGDVHGCGVAVIQTGNFEMSGGRIIYNKRNELAGNSNGGGVWITGGSFIMKGAAVIGYNEAYRGGGVYLSNNGSFQMSEYSVIEGNKAFKHGAAVHKTGSCIFQKTGGIIYGLAVGTQSNKATDPNDGTVHAIQLGTTNTSQYYYDNTLMNNQNFFSNNNTGYTITNNE